MENPSKIYGINGDFFPFSDFFYYKTCMLSRLEKIVPSKFQESPFLRVSHQEIANSLNSKAEFIVQNSSSFCSSYKEIGLFPVKFLANLEKFEEFLLTIEDNCEISHIKSQFICETLAFSPEKRALKLNNSKILGLNFVEDIKIEKIPNNEMYLSAMKIKQTPRSHEKFLWNFEFVVFLCTNAKNKEFFDSLAQMNWKNNSQIDNFYDKSSVVEICDPYELLLSNPNNNHEHYYCGNGLNQHPHNKTLDKTKNNINNKNYPDDLFQPANSFYSLNESKFNRNNTLDVHLQEEKKQDEQLLKQHSKNISNLNSFNEKTSEIHDENKENYHTNANLSHNSAIIRNNTSHFLEKTENNTIDPSQILNEKQTKNHHSNEINQNNFQINASKIESILNKPQENNNYTSQSSENKINKTNNHEIIKETAIDLVKNNDGEIIKDPPNQISIDLEKNIKKSENSPEKILNNDSQKNLAKTQKNQESQTLIISDPPPNLITNSQKKEQAFLEKYSKTLKNGKVFWKYGRKTLFYPSKHKIFFDETLTKIYWGKGKKRQFFSIKDIKEIRHGRNTPNFSRFRVSEREKNKLSFSLITPQRTIDLMALTLIDKEEFVDAINQLISLNQR